MSLLSPGDLFPALNVPLAGGGRLELPGTLAGSYGVVLFYRGSWCPYCNAQLRAFQRAEDSLRDAGIRVAALSVDDEATAQGGQSRTGQDPSPLPVRLQPRCSCRHAGAGVPAWAGRAAR